MPQAVTEWDALLGEIMQPGELKIRTGARTGAVTTARLLGGGVIADLRMPALEVVHRSEHLLRAHEQEVLVHIVLEGAGEFAQANVRLPFQAGDITFRDAHRPSSVHFSGSAVRLIALRLPISRWHGYFTPALLNPALARRDHALTKTVNRFIDQIEAGLPECGPEVMAAFEQSFVLMLGATCQQFHIGTHAPDSQPEGVRWRQAHDYIDAHLFDADLTPADCARALDISERYLYRVLSRHGERFSRVLLNKRLDASAARLRDPRFTRYRISSIAYQCGFKDAAHFSRAFARRFGVAPRTWRACDGVVSARHLG